MAASDASADVLTATFDRYGGVEMKANTQDAATFGRVLKDKIDEWKAAGKRGLWLTVELQCSVVIGEAVAQGFVFHHAQPSYVMLTRWLPEDQENKLPRYGFTQIGVGGVVVNSKGEVLLVQERVSPIPKFQGCWKLPGGLADPGEDFADTVAREVREETGIIATGHKVVSLRHSHNYRFGQGDLYVVVVLAPAEGSSEEIQMDPTELMGAKWFDQEQMEAIVAPSSEAMLDGKISESQWKVIQQALTGPTVVGEKLPPSRPGVNSMLYTAAGSPAASL